MISKVLYGVVFDILSLCINTRRHNLIIEPIHMKKHKRIVIEANGSTDVLKTVEEALPELKPGEVRVRVLAAGGWLR